MFKDIVAGGILFVIYAFIFWALPYLLDASATTVGGWIFRHGWLCRELCTREVKLEM